MAKDLEYQRELVKKLHSKENNEYINASIYTVILDLVEENGIDEVFMILHNVAHDLGKREYLENKFEDAKNWSWE